MTTESTIHIMDHSSQHSENNTSDLTTYKRTSHHSKQNADTKINIKDQK